MHLARPIDGPSRSGGIRSRTAPQPHTQGLAGTAASVQWYHSPMNAPARSPIAAVIERFLPGMKFPVLFAVLAVLLGLDLVLPDPVPMIDEVGLAILTLLVGSWRSRREPNLPPRDVTPQREPPQIQSDDPSVEDLDDSP